MHPPDASVVTVDPASGRPTGDLPQAPPDPEQERPDRAHAHVVARGDLVTPDPGPWQTPVTGGRSHRRLRRALVLAGVVVVAAAVGVAATGAALVATAERNLVRRPVEELVEPEPTQPVNILVVGSDSRDGLTDEELQRYHLGTVFSGQRSDTVMLVSIPADRSGASILSFPRDLRVPVDGGFRKLTETFAGGPDAVIEVLHDTYGLDVHHYVQVSVTSFLTVVDTVGGVEVCLDEPLVDPKSGADFAAGCHTFDGADALAFVRSRSGGRGDYERIERQQAFLGALLRRLVATRTLVDLPRLFNVVEEVAGQVVTDDELGLGDLRRLAEELRGAADGSIPMTALPSYVETIDGISYVLPYAPGAEALLSDVRSGRVLDDRGSRDERAATTVAVLTGGGAPAADRVVRTLHWSGFQAYPESGGSTVEPTTVVYAVPGRRAAADRVAAVLGARVRRLPADVTAPDDATVVVAAGADALDTIGSDDAGAG